jgi:hypothetical protein
VARPHHLARLLAFGVVAVLAFVVVGPTGRAESTAPPAGEQAGSAGAGGTARSIVPPVTRVALYGDSLTFEARRYLPAIAAAHRVQLEERSFPGVAICDWFDDLASRLPTFRPDVVVLAFYGNSATECMADGPGRFLQGQAKADKYERDATMAAALARAVGAEVVLVGAPRSFEQQLDPGWERVRDAYRRVANRSEGDVSFVDAGPTIAPGGQYAQTQPCLPREQAMVEYDGARPCFAGRILVRSSDGLHFCPHGLDHAFGGWNECPRYMSGAYRYGLVLVGAARQVTRA